MAVLEPGVHVGDGVRCSVRDGDPSRSEAVVFAHGNPGPMDDWEESGPAVAAFSRVVAIDMPGYGRAEHPRGFDYTVPGYATYLGSLLDRLSVGKAHLVPHDFGGPWGLKWALGHPDRVGSLTLIKCGVLEGYRWHGFARIWQGGRRIRGGRAPVRRALYLAALSAVAW